MRNRYAGECVLCKKRVEIGAGYFQKVQKGDGELYKITNGKWVVRCPECVGKGNRIVE